VLNIGINDMKTLKNHPFFKGIDWANLSKTTAPKREVMHMLELDDAEINDFPPSSPLSAVNTGSMRPLITGRVLKKVAWLIYKPR